MSRELLAPRYASDDSNSINLQSYITETLPFMDFEEARQFYQIFEANNPPPEDRALLGCNDRFYLLTYLLHRPDALNPWLYNRCREVEADPDGYLDLWARYHYKSTIITFAGNIQDILIDPEITIAIFSISLKVATPFLEQIKEEFEGNELLKETYPDVLWFEPRKEAPHWSNEGIVVKRNGNPKEKTVEAHGLIEAMPTGRHFKKLVYDDVVTEKHVDNPDVIKKVQHRIELSDNLGTAARADTKEVTRVQYIGTRYSYADPYGVLLQRKVLKPRIYPATDDGRSDGNPVFISKEEWEKIKIKQHGTYAAQMLQNPAAGEEASFDLNWVKSFFVRPRSLNIYITVDPSLGRSASSDNTAMAVIGIDANDNKYLLDGYCHKMDINQRYENLVQLYKKWSTAPGVILTSVGYERYGMLSDLEVFEGYMQRDGFFFKIEEVNWTGDSVQSKTARVNRLQAPFKGGDFFVPALVWHESAPGQLCLWKLNDEKYEIDFKAIPKGRETREMAHAKQNHRRSLIQYPIKRMTNGKEVYDVTRTLLQQMASFPFSENDDFVDAVSRYFELDPVAAQPLENDQVEEIEDIY